MSPSLHRLNLRTLTMGLAILAYFMAYFLRVAPATLASDFTADFQTNATALGTLAGVYFYVTTAMQVPAGVMVDRLGVRSILALGCTVAALGSLTASAAPTFFWAAIGRLLIGLGTSVLFIAMLKLIAELYPARRFATVAGIAMILGASGSVVAGAPLGAIIELTSWRLVFVGSTVILAFIALGSWILIQPSASEAAEPATQPSTWASALQAVIRTPQVLVGFAINCGMTGTFMSFTSLWAVPFLQSHGLTLGQASMHLSAFFVAFSVASMLIGRLSDAMGNRAALLIGCATGYTFLLACMAGLNMNESSALSYGVFIALGLCTSGFTLTWSQAKDACAPSSAGMAMAVVNTGGFVCAAVLQPLAGWLMDLRYSSEIAAGTVPHYNASDYQLCVLVHLVAALLGLFAAAVIHFVLRATSISGAMATEISTALPTASPEAP